MSAIGLNNGLLKRRHVLPGFRLSLGFTLFYLTSLVLIPLLALVLRPMEMGLDGFWAAITTPRVLASLRLSFGMAAAAAVIDSVFGLVIAWVLVRYRFPGKKLDRCSAWIFLLPCRQPWPGIALDGALCAQRLAWRKIFIEYGYRYRLQALGRFRQSALIFIALAFIGLPFVVRTVEPVLEGYWIRTMEEAAAQPWAQRGIQTFRPRDPSACWYPGAC